jgi:hypothetical protein
MRSGEPDRAGARELSMAEQHELLSARMSRRAVLRGGALGLGAAMLGPGLMSCSSGRTARPPRAPRTITPTGPEVLFGHHGAPGGRHLAFGPDPSTQMRVAWQVASSVEQPFIRIGSTDGNLGSPIPARLRALPTRLPYLGAAYTQYYVHAEIDGLSPDSDYVYAVGHRGFDDAQWLKASVATFRTAPSTTHTASPFTFTAFGDQGTNSHGAASMALVATQQPAFHLLAGDIAYADGTGRGGIPAAGADATHDVFQPLLWDRYLATIDRLASTVPWMVAAGNHDMEAAYSADGYGGLQDRFVFPQNGPHMCPAVYSFVYGNVGIVSLDANDVSFEIRANLGYSGGAQTAWLDKVLASLRRNARVDFIVVFFHHCAYCTGETHGSEGGVRAKWVPLFDRYKVDLVINAHNHVYERTDPLRDGAATGEAPPGSTVRPEVDGTTYLTAGGGGRDVESFSVVDSYAGHERNVDQVRSQIWNGVRSLGHQDVGWSRTRYSGFSLVAVDVKPAPAGQLSSMTVKALAQNGREIDRLEMHRVAGHREE